MSVINRAVAVDMGENVFINAIDRNGSDVSFFLKRDDYDLAKSVLTDGIPVKNLSNIITPHDIVGYMFESNPESQNVMIDVEVQRGIRNKMKDTSRYIAYAGGFATIIMALIIFYLAVVKDPGTAAGAAGTAASGMKVI